MALRLFFCELASNNFCAHVSQPHLKVRCLKVLKLGSIGAEDSDEGRSHSHGWSIVSTATSDKAL